MASAFSVKTQAFEGPLDLLLNLIEERKMLISDVSLAQVADDFLTYISTQDAYPIADTAQFIVVAATLLLIKSRALLPVLELTQEEEGDMHDLEKRLKLLALMRRAAQSYARVRSLYITPGVPIRDPLFVPPPDLSSDSLRDAAQRVVAEAPRPAHTDAVTVAPVVSLDEMIERLTERVQRAVKLSFTEFTSGAVNVRDVVVSFLAMLELVKRGFAQVEQSAHFDEITIEYTGTLDAPRYD